MDESQIIQVMISLIGGLGGGAGIATLIEKIVNIRKAKRGETVDAKLDAHLKPITDRLTDIESKSMARDKELKEIRLDTIRTQMMIMMEHQPHNHDTILKLAEFYFCTAKGNWVMEDEFLRWSEKENIRVPLNIQTAIDNLSSSVNK